MATITHPTGIGYCMTGLALAISVPVIYKGPLDRFHTPLHIIIAMSYNASLDCYRTPLTYYHCSAI